MLVTEAEAPSMWCPMARVPLTLLPADQNNASVNRTMSPISGEPDRGCYCLGSGCMMWRWENHVENMRIDGLPDDAYRSKDLQDPRGFCGLAGDLRRKDPR